MDLTGHIFLALDPEDRTAMRQAITAEQGVDDFVKLSATFDITRDDHECLHLFLLALEDLMPELQGLGTIVIGHDQFYAEGMGYQYYFDPPKVKTMAKAYDRVTPALIDAALDRAFPDFDPDYDGEIKEVIAAQFAQIRECLRPVADQSWAVVAGMF